MEVAFPRSLQLVALLTAACTATAFQLPAPHDDGRQQAEKELREGIALTSRSQFQDAIKHFLVARGHVTDAFALEFNLALCYVGTRQFPDAIRILTQLDGGQRAADVKNLLAQAFIGDHQAEPALREFQKAADLAPGNERLYVLVSQACLDEGLYDAGLQVLAVGLRNLPNSARLHFQRGLFHSNQDDNDLANGEFQLAKKLAPNSEIAYIADAEQALVAGQVQDVIRTAREAMHAGYNHYLLLTMLGEALLRAGATPDTPAEFAEARTVLEKAVAIQPGYSSSHIALGRIYLTLEKTPDALVELETGRRLDPRNKAVYPPLATAYRRVGQVEKAKEALIALAALNREEAARIGSSDGGHSGYLSGRSKPDK